MSIKHIEATPQIIESLSSADAVMSKLIERYKVIKYELDEAYFTSLISTIIGQQLSNKVADVIWRRFQYMVGEDITPEKVLEINDDSYRCIGISYAKTTYIKNIAHAIKSEQLTTTKFPIMADEEIINQLIQIKGIGRWTAEMFLIFSLGRENIFSSSDGGLERAINILYGNGNELSKKEHLTISDKWKPYKSIASLYLWKSLDNG